jgi:hypothetical protein
MPLILRNRRDAFAFRFGRQSGIRATDDAVEQLQDQLQRERAQHRYNMFVKEQELALVLRELARRGLSLRGSKPSRARRVRAQAYIDDP